MENSAAFFSNHDCAFFPCHTWPEGEAFNCLFCFCPLYPLDCGGKSALLPNGIKDCSGCTIPHRADSYDYIIKRLSERA